MEMVDLIPIWAIVAVTILVVMAAIELGQHIGNFVRRRSPNEKESPVSAIVGAILGLSAFLLAFTFGVVWDRHDQKRALVREDAIAIRTAWRRSDFLPDADRLEAAEIFRKYVAVRLEFSQNGNFDPEKVKDLQSQLLEFQDRLWTMAVVNARKDMNSDVAALYIESLNEMTGVHQNRIAVGIQARVPLEIWLALYCITILGMMSVGYQTGIAESKRSLAWPVVAIAFALAFGLIASLDRPDSGFFKVPQTPLLDLQKVMDEKAH
jgi:hypothetical protein